MIASQKKWIALIRAIGPVTHKRMSMAQLRDACKDAGFENVRTILATGNILFSSGRSASNISKNLKDVVAAHNLNNEVFLRRPKELEAVLTENPFPDAAAERPNHMLVLFMAGAPSMASIAAIGDHAGPERVRVSGREAYIDYVEGVGRSKLTAARLEKYLGLSGTARNWNTIRKLHEAAGA